MDLIISDIDGTVAGDPEAERAFASWFEQRRPNTDLVYASGRHLESVVDTLASGHLPSPVLLVTAAGTAMHHYPSLEPVAAWCSGRGVSLDGWDAEHITWLATRVIGLAAQSACCQTEQKRSFTAVGAGAALRRQLRRELARAGLRAEIAISDARNVDVTPAGRDKGGTAIAARRALRPRGYQRVSICGDSGNDLSMLRARAQLGATGVIVANAVDGLHRLRGPNLHHATLGYADGVRQVLDRLWPEAGAQLGRDCAGAS